SADSDLTDQVADNFKEAISEIQESYAGKVDLETIGKNSILECFINSTLIPRSSPKPSSTKFRLSRAVESTESALPSLDAGIMSTFFLRLLARRVIEPGFATATRL